MTPGAGQRVDSAPHPPVHVTPRLELGLQVEQVVVYVPRRVPRVVIGQAARAVNHHSTWNIMEHLKTIILHKKGSILRVLDRLPSRQVHPKFYLRNIFPRHFILT